MVIPITPLLNFVLLSYSLVLHRENLNTFVTETTTKLHEYFESYNISSDTCLVGSMHLHRGMFALNERLFLSLDELINNSAFSDACLVRMKGYFSRCMKEVWDMLKPPRSFWSKRFYKINSHKTQLRLYYRLDTSGLIWLARSLIHWLTQSLTHPSTHLTIHPPRAPQAPTPTPEGGFCLHVYTSLRTRQPGATIPPVQLILLEDRVPHHASIAWVHVPHCRTKVALHSFIHQGPIGCGTTFRQKFLIQIHCHIFVKSSVTNCWITIQVKL